MGRTHWPSFRTPVIKISMYVYRETGLVDKEISDGDCRIVNRKDNSRTLPMFVQLANKVSFCPMLNKKDDWG
jgi:hypothetical protein